MTAKEKCHNAYCLSEFDVEPDPLHIADTVEYNCPHCGYLNSYPIYKLAWKRNAFDGMLYTSVITRYEPYEYVF